jgi:hypothetical protein
MLTDQVLQLIGQGLGHIDQVQPGKCQIAIGTRVLVARFIDHRSRASQQVEQASQEFFEGVGWIGASFFMVKTLVYGLEPFSCRFHATRGWQL